ncbi:MAG: methylenetetrahydrofolate reductase [NAD(P)H] [Burkholderiales bacterium]|jgi:methylenetetrahydrofolate reductase (NADPH)|nr:methylenetetrahydrofolate reductase [NAD(P)H] [Burkholderiales bacterium]
MDAEKTAFAKPMFSLEFFPPKSPEGIEKLGGVQRALRCLQPAFCSVTFGAGGSTRQGTLDTVLGMKRDGVNAVPHLSCIGATKAQIRDVIEQYRAHGIHHLVALRGDLPSGTFDGGAFRYAAELVAFIRDISGDWFHIDVAAYPEVHPQAKSAEDDARYFKRKIDAGANSAITQYFYNADAYWHFVDACAALGVTAPVVPGIMPIWSYSRLSRFSEMCGAEIPRWIRRRMEGYGDDHTSVRAFGLDIVTDLCARLLERGAPGLHFYTLNQSELTLEICRRLGLVAEMESSAV